MKQRNTMVSIQGNQFLINGELTYKGRYWQGHRIEGLLMNTRMVQGIFDDKNPDTVGRWAYPDTGVWDPERNTREFIEAMPTWKEHGILAFTINLQGGSPEGYSKTQPWHNSAFLSDGTLDSEYMDRLERIIDCADELGMVVILGYFYFGQDIRLGNERAVKQAVVNATTWVLQKGYTNVIIEIANECDIVYKHSIILAPRIHELIELAQITGKALRPENPLLVGTSFSGRQVPTDNVIEVSDFLLIHGNGSNVLWVPQQIKILREKKAYRGQPILNNEDDHFDFDQEENHLVLSVQQYVSWGYFDPGDSNYRDGYQCPPVQWGLNTELKKSFFTKMKEITGVETTVKN
ncbi:hypothetical protein [Ammoniphilus sp. YIM 78166]|uniref:hypothetical protein n=1 Tax=Ammoniphilus sp. YIM 78166 TaxID=1644106 RepID=UPI00196B3010|nr:hypothetical protein [Ammoniphilus sp. YIM 78166]